MAGGTGLFRSRGQRLDHTSQASQRTNIQAPVVLWASTWGKRDLSPLLALHILQTPISGELPAHLGSDSSTRAGSVCSSGLPDVHLHLQPRAASASSLSERRRRVAWKGVFCIRCSKLWKIGVAVFGQRHLMSAEQVPSTIASLVRVTEDMRSAMENELKCLTPSTGASTCPAILTMVISWLEGNVPSRGPSPPRLPTSTSRLAERSIPWSHSYTRSQPVPITGAMLEGAMAASGGSPSSGP